MLRPDLQKACDDVLIDGLPGGLRRVVDGLLAKGVPPRVIMARVRHAARGHVLPAQGGVPLAVLAVEAYLGRRAAAGLPAACVPCYHCGDPCRAGAACASCGEAQPPY